MSRHATVMRAASIALVLMLPLLAAGDSGTGVDSAPASADAAGITTPANLWDVRVEQAPGDRTAVIVSGDRPMEHTSFVLDTPYRLVIDLPGVVNRLGQARIDVDQGGVAQVRTAQFRLTPSPISRVVLDLEEPLDYEIESRDSDLVITFGGPAAAVAVTEQNALPEWTRPTSRPEPVAPRAEAMPAPPADEPPAVDAVAQVLEAALAESAEVEATPAVEPSAQPPAAPVVEPEAAPVASRSLEPDAIDRLLATPPLAAQAPESSAQTMPSSFETRKIVTDAVTYTGKRISLNLVDANIKEVFRLFHEISGINFVLDPSVSGRVTIVVDNVPWDQALDLILKNNGLDKVLENNVIRIASTEKLAQEAAQRKQLKEAKELEVEPITITRTLSYAKAKEVERVIRDGGVLSQRGKVIVDERTNTLIISDIPKKVDPLDTLISTLDSETPQVMIEARVVETSREFTQDLGVVWGLSAIADASRGTTTGLPFPNQASVRYGLNLPGGGGASNLAFKFGNIIDSFTLDIALNTLETEGRARVLSSPKIATQNNERAEIEQGVRIPVVNTTATEIDVEFVSASLRMEVTPQITAEGTIILDIVVENNSPDFVNTAGDIPSIRTQRAQTKVLIGDGGTTVIGGIFVVNEGQNEIGVPWFRKLPVFGWLFKAQTISRQNRELLIFITPKIMRLG